MLETAYIHYSRIFMNPIRFENADIESYLVKYDIVILIETWIKNDLDINNFLNEYDYFSVHDKG